MKLHTHRAEKMGRQFRAFTRDKTGKKLKNAIRLASESEDLVFTRPDWKYEGSISIDFSDPSAVVQDLRQSISSKGFCIVSPKTFPFPIYVYDLKFDDADARLYSLDENLSRFKKSYRHFSLSPKGVGSGYDDLNYVDKIEDIYLETLSELGIEADRLQANGFFLSVGKQVDEFEFRRRQIQRGLRTELPKELEGTGVELVAIHVNRPTLQPPSRSEPGTAGTLESNTMPADELGGSDNNEDTDAISEQKNVNVDPQTSSDQSHPFVARILQRLTRSPSGGLFVGLFVALVVASLASAGLNTVPVARLLIGAAFLIGAVYITYGGATSGLRLRHRLGVIVLMGLFLFAIERVEANYQPRVAEPPVVERYPTPPLKLMMKPLVPGYDYTFVKVPSLPLAVTYLQRPQGGYAGFGKIGDNAKDDAMLGIQAASFKNLSDAPLRLSWTLTVQGEGRSFTLLGDGKGRWERQLDENDWSSRESAKLKWQLSPTTLKPHESISLVDLAFVAPDVDDATRALIASNSLDESYKVTLNLNDELSGDSTSLLLPFGVAPVPSNDPQRKKLREMIEGNGN